MTSLATDLPMRLRTETRDLHDAAENHRFQRALVKGDLEKSAYVQWLEQMALVHRALDDAITATRGTSVAVASIPQEQLQSPYLDEDLAHFGVQRDDIRPVPATEAFVSDIAKAANEQPLAIFGIHYVLEGSNNGSRFIAMGLRRAFGLTPGAGDRYLDPYAEAQPVKWAEFKETMAALEVTTKEADLLVEWARKTFQAVTNIGEDLLKASTEG